MIGLVDCNNFYASCERIFRPDLASCPIVVLSNNDGCIIARSQEAKELGIDMASPYYKIRRDLNNHGVKVFSSNYPLYGSISARVMRVLGQFTPDVEVYSIDEAFIDTTGVGSVDLNQFGAAIRQRVYQWVSIPVCVGFGKTKTLAKIANRWAKKQTESGVFVIDSNNKEIVLSKLAVDDIWGIGRRSAVKLREAGIYNGFDFYRASDSLIKSKLGVVGLRTVWELRGEKAVLDEPDQAHSVSSSRSFGTAVTTLSDLREALACYVENAYRKLRGKGLYAGGITIYIKTNRHAKNQPQYSNMATAAVEHGKGDLSYMISKADELLKKIYRSGYRYIKTGVIFSDLSETEAQPTLFSTPVNEKSKGLDDALAKISGKFGVNSVFHAVQGTERKWKMKQDFLSKSFTTRWNEIPTIKI